MFFKVASLVIKEKELAESSNDSVQLLYSGYILILSN